IVDNAGQSGTNSDLGSPGIVDLVLRGGAVASFTSVSTVNSLLIGSNTWVLAANLNLNVFSNVTLQAGGGIKADGTGSPAGQGPGAGRTYSAPPYAGGGGAYGGCGGAGGQATAFGGFGYGPVVSPSSPGSGGGYGSPTTPTNNAGAGGGTIHLTVQR